MKVLIQNIAQLRVEIEANQRLRWGLFLIVAITGLYLALVLDDIQIELNAEHESLVRHYGELISLEPEEYWQDKLALEEKTLEQKEIVVWKASSEALARANMQSKISTFAQLASLQKFKLNVGSFQPHAKLKNISVVRFELDAGYTEDKVLDFINALESNIPIFNVARMTLRTGTKRSRVTMLIYAFYYVESERDGK